MKYTKTTTTEQTANLLKKAKNVAIFAHTNPDGDAIGSTTALSFALKKLGIDSKIFCDTVLSSVFEKIELSKFINKEFSGEFDLFVAVDCGDIFRLGEFSSVYANHQNTLTIDHHGGEYYSKNNCVIKYSSTAQIVYEVIKFLNIVIDDQIANSLYVGLATDTGNFAYSNTDKSTFEFASNLLNYKIDVETISRLFFKDISLKRAKFFGERMSAMRSFYNDKLVIIYALKEDLDKHQLDFNAVEGLVRFATDVETCKVAVAISEYSKNSFKISLRGKGINVRPIAELFGGGGHPYAAGCQISGFFEDVVDKIVRYVGFEL